MRTMKNATETSSDTSGSAAPSRAGFEVTVNRKAFAAVARRISTMVPKRPVPPILSHVRLRADDGLLAVDGTDLNVYMTTTLPARVAEGGRAVIVNAAALAAALRKLPDGDLTVRFDRTAVLELVIAGVTVRLDAIVNPIEFPAFPAAPACHPVNAARLGWMLATVAHATCEDETRFHLCGTLLTLTGADGGATTTDGHRLAHTKEPFASDVTGEWILCAAGAREAARLLAKGKGKGEARFGATDGTYPKVTIVYGDTTLTIKTIAARFPPIEQVFPRVCHAHVMVDRKALLATLERVKLVCTTMIGAQLAAVNDEFTVSARSTLGEHREVVTSATLDPDCKRPTMTGVNPVYLAEALAALDEEIVHLYLCNGLDPIKVGGEGPAVFVIMPMRM